MAEVSWMRPELRNMLAGYQLIRDVLEGSDAMKGKRNVASSFTSGANGFENIGGRRINDSRRYLPQPNQQDVSPANVARYRMYVERAQWYGATARTLEGMVGQIFQRPPQITIPDVLKPMLQNVDGASVTLVQQMLRAADYGVAYGRGGLLTDYPSTAGEVTQSDVNAGKTMPTITCFAPWQIINWRVEQQGSTQLLTLLVVMDLNVYDTTDDFESRPVMQFRVFEIDPDSGYHYVQVWRENVNTNNSPVAKKQMTMVDYYQPLAPGGAPLTKIPFTFFGAKNNDAIPDKAPMLDLAEVNLGHFRDSADYQESVHMLGQPTPWASGLTPQWVKEVWEGKKIPLGSRAVIPLPVGAAMGLLQVSPNTLAYEAMKEKESMMVMLGAKLMEQATGQQTATGELIDETSETSLLQNVATNVAAAYKFALTQAALFMGLIIDEASDTIKITLNTSFQFTRMSAGDRQELVGEWQKGAISWTEMRAGLRGTGVATQTDVVAKAEIAAEVADAIATGIIASPVGVDIPGAQAGGVLPPATGNQAPNPVPPAKKDKPSGKPGGN